MRCCGYTDANRVSTIVNRKIELDETISSYTYTYDQLAKENDMEVNHYYEKHMEEIILKVKSRVYVEKMKSLEKMESVEYTEAVTMVMEEEERIAERIYPWSKKRVMGSLEESLLQEKAEWVLEHNVNHMRQLLE